MTSAQIKETLIRVTKQAYADRMFAATSGNLSMYDRETGHMYITPGSYPYEIMTVDDVMIIDLDGNIIEGIHKPSSEWRMHAAVYRNDDTVNAIVHTHSPYATAFSINHLPIPVTLFEIVYFLGGDIPVADAAIPGTDAVGENCVKVLNERYGCLMANHGALAVGDTLDRAYTRAVYIEDAAHAYSIALTHGPVHVIESKDINKILGK
ncbi:MAG: class II aldolase/adducin family protein [Clostridia bacterium]|nr:class II aldolase/adducin family protein [Clostridia bacterium]